MYEVKDNSGQRLDVYLTNLLGISRSKVQKLIKNNQVFVNDEVEDSNYRVVIGDYITVNEDFNKEIDIPKENIPLDIVFEDEDLLVINKKSGMVVHPGNGNYTGTLVNALLYKYDLDFEDKVRPGIVHRIDKDTSGLILVAKNEKTKTLLSEMIKNKEVERIYIALVEGTFNHETGTIDAPIGRDVKNREKMTVTDVNSKEAITHFRVLKRFKNHTLIECKLDTGRTHQIRVHMAYIKHPVVNDPVYNNKKATSFGQLLHAKRLSFVHPITKERLVFEVDVPEEFTKIMNEVTAI